MAYNLRHINEAIREHVENNFRPLPADLRSTLSDVCSQIDGVLEDAVAGMEQYSAEVIDELRGRCSLIKDHLSALTRVAYDRLQQGNTDNLAVTYVYLNVLQETQEFITSLRKMLRAVGKLNLAPASYRSFSTHVTALTTLDAVPDPQ